MRHGAAQQSFEEALAAQARVDADNIQLVADGVDQLARMLVTEADRQRAEIGPVYEQYAGMAEELRTGLRARAEELRARILQNVQVSGAGAAALAEILRAQSARRRAAFRAMRQEFQRTMDDVSSQFRLERAEREAQAVALDELEKKAEKEAEDAKIAQKQKSER